MTFKISGNMKQVPAQILLNDEKVTCSGYLERKTKSTLSPWIRSYVVVVNGIIYIYKKNKSTKACYISDLSFYDELSVYPKPDKEPRWTFGIKSQNDFVTELQFSAPSEREMKTWMEQFHKAMGTSKNELLKKDLGKQDTSKYNSLMSGGKKDGVVTNASNVHDFGNNPDNDYTPYDQSESKASETMQNVNKTQIIVSPKDEPLRTSVPKEFRQQTAKYDGDNLNGNDEYIPCKLETSVNIQHFNEKQIIATSKNELLRSILPTVITHESSDGISDKDFRSKNDVVFNLSNTDVNDGTLNDYDNNEDKSENSVTIQTINETFNEAINSKSAMNDSDNLDTYDASENEEETSVNIQNNNKVHSIDDNKSTSNQQALNDNDYEVQNWGHVSECSYIKIVPESGSQYKPNSKDYIFYGTRAEAIIQMQNRKLLGLYLVRQENERNVLTVHCKSIINKFELINDTNTNKVYIRGQSIAFDTIDQLLSYYHNHVLPHNDCMLSIPYKLADSDVYIT